MKSQEPESGQAISGRFRIGEWSVDPDLDEISRGAEVVKLEPRTMRLLCRLAESPGHTVSNQQLLDSVWPGVIVGPASVYQAVFALRKILGDTGGNPTYIATVARKGYRLVAPVEMHSAGANASVPGTPAPSPAAVRRMTRSVVAGIALAALMIVAAAIFLQLNGTSEKAIATATRAASDTWPRPGLVSLAVLPLQASPPGEANELFAATIKDLLQNRLMTQKELLVVSLFSAGSLGEPDADVQELGRRLQVKYVLRGDAAREENRLRVNVSLVDTSTGAQLWSQRYTREAQEITRLREEIVSKLGSLLDAHIGPGGNTPVNLDAHTEYVRGFREYRKVTSAGFGAARDIFQRATELYPDYSRNYYGLAVTVKMFEWYPDPRHQQTRAQRTELQRSAINRALDLDPEFGEAIIERASITADPREAEQLFHRAMDLAPSNGFGPYAYTLFLFEKSRDGEAIAMIDRGLRIDPLNSILMERKAFFLKDYRGDVAGHEALLREVLANHPDNPSAALALGWSRHALSGETADAIGILEREAARDPAGLNARQLVTNAYLDVDDLAAADSASKGTTFGPVTIALYLRAPHPIESLPAGALSEWGGFAHTPFDQVSYALRDEALASGDYAPALSAFDKARSLHAKGGLNTVSMDLIHAHTLILSGDLERGRALAKQILQLFDVEQVGRPAHWFARSRAMAYAMLGDDERALAELATSVQHKNLSYWWYTAELDPLFAHLRKDSRFQALAETARQHRARQRVLLDEMRRKGEVPKRP